MNSVYIDQSQSFSAGALYSTTEDLLRLDQALYDDKLLSRKTQEVMFTPAIGEIGPAPTSATAGLSTGNSMVERSLTPAEYPVLQV